MIEREVMATWEGKMADVQMHYMEWCTGERGWSVQLYARVCTLRFIMKWRICTDRRNKYMTAARDGLRNGKYVFIASLLYNCIQLPPAEIRYYSFLRCKHLFNPSFTTDGHLCGETISSPTRLTMATEVMALISTNYTST